VAPIVSVLMATHNDVPFLRAAIDSILNQTFTDFEFIIVNDASTDETPAILDSYDDPRIVRHDNPTNLKLAASLNHGLEIAQGELIARMDGDDISLPERLERQVRYMAAHSEIGILGTQWQHIGPQGEILRRSSHPLTHGLIMWTYLTRLAYPLTHATVLMRRDLIVDAGGYNTDYPREQDGELFLRLIDCTRYANLPDALYVRRTARPRDAALDHFATYFPLTLDIRRRCIARLLGRDISIEELQALIFPTPRRHRQRLELQPSLAAVKEAITLLLEVFYAMDEQGFFTPEERAKAHDEIGDVVVNMLSYCQALAFRACDTLPTRAVARYLSQRIAKGLVARLRRRLGGKGS
jgi:glycosyltransferase involved in cell wall biosynthesis